MVHRLEIVLLVFLFLFFCYLKPLNPCGEKESNFSLSIAIEYCIKAYENQGNDHNLEQLLIFN